MSLEKPSASASDADKTLTGDNAALIALNTAIQRRRADRSRPKFYHGRVSGRAPYSLAQLAQEQRSAGAPLPDVDFEVGMVGEHATVRRGPGLVPIANWPRPEMIEGWDRSKIIDVMGKTAEVRHGQAAVQDARNQGDYKWSYELSEGFVASFKDHGEAYRASLEAELARVGVAAQVILSGEFLDFMAPGIDKGSALRAVLEELGVEEENTYTSGDSNNDRKLVLVGNAILVANAALDFRLWAANGIPPDRLYESQKPYAGGVHEGLIHYGVLEAVA
ncbi:MAG TPA: HAD family hydrolase [Candidatus Saccharimonadales bacterium]